MQAKRWDSDEDGRITSEDKEVHADLFKARWGRDGRHEIEPPPGSKSFHTPFTYASMVKSIDESLGQIMRHLKSKRDSRQYIHILLLRQRWCRKKTVIPAIIRYVAKRLMPTKVVHGFR